ncbi:XRE family transcriptional regulator [Paraburkholderia sp. 5N]|uniref:XRE family transcriptional regulator n=2 Tax=Paraburkholderia elongata TaxID=2675747 RepID=A0A972NUB9_9BURK|nr:XRE family transcriptional regulator [Paraburkholderia elongata]
MKYKAPSAKELQRLKDELGLSSARMAKLFGLSSGRHWRGYTEQGEKRREISAQTLFFGLAQKELSAEAIERILARMRRAGATIDLSADVGEQE